MSAGMWRGRVAATSSIRSSVAGSRPYPDLTSIVVTPQSVSSRPRAAALLVSSSVEARRVARTVDMMPPPARAISA